jgi:hypothetical protein
MVLGFGMAWIDLGLVCAWWFDGAYDSLRGARVEFHELGRCALSGTRRARKLPMLFAWMQGEAEGGHLGWTSASILALPQSSCLMVLSRRALRIASLAML